MGLGSVMQTALSGISAAQSAVEVIANNLANSQTNGFKASSPTFATQRPQTQSPGSAPSGSGGGTNPIQVGSGVRSAGTSVNFTQGTIAVSSDPMNLALQGDGLFILEGSGGQQLYTRDGQFSLNADGQLVSSGGMRVLGHGVDQDFRLETDGLAPLTIPLGMQTRAADGSAATLTGHSIGADGRIMGRFSDGQTRVLGQIQVARFANPSGLQQQGGNTFASGLNSGPPLQGSPGEKGNAEIMAAATELSNTDVGRELVGLIRSSTAFRANLAVIQTADAMLDELTNLPRRN